MTSNAERGAPADEPPPLFDGGPLVTSEDAARALGVKLSQLLYALYKAPEESRYRTFEIPKRTGGVREIAAPVGLIRDLQTSILPELVARYRRHPGAHGFLSGASILTNAREHEAAKLVLNIDLKDFFPTINFGRVRGLLMSPAFGMGPAAATIFAQIVTRKNGLPQGAPTSPVLSNFIATELDRRLTRLAKQNAATYSRYADDITFSTNKPAFPASLVGFDIHDDGRTTVVAGEALAKEIAASGFEINAKKVRLQTHSMQQSVTGLLVNARANVARERIRRVRAMLHAWAKFGLDAAGHEHFRTYRRMPKGEGASNLGAAFRNVVYGELAFIKMIRGAGDPVFLKLAARVLDLDPNPSKFIRQMVFGADDYEIFISHASEDRAAVARPIHEALERAGLKAFLDDEHIAWGENFTRKINRALAASRTVLAIISPVSVTKDWPMAEVNTALTLEVSGKKNVFCLLVGKPDLSQLPLIAGKDYLVWQDDPDHVARKLKERISGKGPAGAATVAGTVSVPTVPLRPPPVPVPPPLPIAAVATPEARPPSLLERLLGAKKNDDR
ncbi:MAG: reverse transcriptase domain-containing protein [Hyphomicrobium sp.]|nr:reverse transcriptase domain-containing protein [Hyphomicrobium sp.]